MNKGLKIGLGVLTGCLIVGPWIWIGILLNESDSPDSDNPSVKCPDVSYESCNGSESCLESAKIIMDSCAAMDTHNDLPYTFVKYQTGNDPTELNVGVDLDKSWNNLYEDQILNKSRGDSHTSL